LGAYSLNPNGKKYLMCGNNVIGEAAIQAGCRFYAGYPITPQNELPAYMSKRMQEEGGIFIQAESELAAINMVMGASMTGARAMTSSSSPGISLKQEGISYLSASELPAVIVNVMRGGPGLGNIAPSQSDYFQAVKGGGHGDYNIIVLAPAYLQDLADLTALAFHLADKYRNPVMLLADGIIGQMMEPVEIRTPEKGFYPKDWVLTGAEGRSSRFIRSLLLEEGQLEAHNEKLQEKFELIKENEVRYVETGVSDAEILVIAYGTCARIARAAVLKARREGCRAGLLRPVCLWPFPQKRLFEIAPRVKKMLAVEMSAGQMVEDVRLAVNGACPVYFHGRTGGGVPSVEEILENIKGLRAR
jgi:2-oxoglutarate/2-oxoacid ferredoxin oxidoreductase subunit alpha